MRPAGDDAEQPSRNGLYELMDRYIDGDRGAFRQLHARLAPRLRGLLIKIVRNAEVVDDLVQLTLLKSHLARERFVVSGPDRDRAVQGWYFAIAKNVAMDHLRGRYRAQERSVTSEASADAVEAIADSSPDLESLHVADERESEIVRRVRDAIAALPSGQREVVELHKLQGMSMAQIAERLELREGAVRVRAHRAYRTLARLLSGTRAETWLLWWALLPGQG